MPLNNNVLYTAQQTFTRTFDVANGTASDAFFPEVSIQIGDLLSYPVSYSTTDVYPPYYIYDTIDYPNDPDTIWILDAEIFQDSATQFFAPISDPDLIWLDSEAFLNNTMAVDPWSYGVATFDGLDENGYPYAFGTSTSGFADHLTSKKIDLSAPLLLADTLYLSFLYQPQGFSDAPESGDSLHLEFYEAGAAQWNEVWVGGGSSVEDFKLGHIPINSSVYFNDGFQFRFKNYGGLSGSLDHYHLDYVHLRSLSNLQDTLVKDFAMVYPVNTLLEDFTSVPWDHYQNNFTGKMSNNVGVVIRNGYNTVVNATNAGKVEVFHSAALEGTFPLPAFDLSNGDISGNYQPFTTYHSFHDFSSGYYYDETKPGPSEEFDILTQADVPLGSDFKQNDSILSKQVFENYYAYDDGSAELAYGPTGVQSRLAIQYTPYEADSLIGAMIHFVPSVNDVSNNLFLLTVWDDNGGEPGAVLYEDEVFFPRQPKYQYAQNVFTYYFLKDTIRLPINGTFYIGWRQFDGERLNVGLDMNIPNADKTFFSVDNGASWDTSSFQGSVMIRPLFSTEMDASLGIEKIEIENIQSVLYPNPTNDLVTIETNLPEYDGVEVYDLRGTLILKTDVNIVNLATFNSGIYLFRIKGDPTIYKVIKH